VPNNYEGQKESVVVACGDISVGVGWWFAGNGDLWVLLEVEDGSWDQTGCRVKKGDAARQQRESELLWNVILLFPSSILTLMQGLRYMQSVRLHQSKSKESEKGE